MICITHFVIDFNVIKMNKEYMRKRIEKEIGRVYCYSIVTHEYPIIIERKRGFGKRFKSITAAYRYYFGLTR